VNNSQPQVPAAAAQRLAARITQALTAPPVAAPDSRLLRVEVPLADTKPLDWLRAQPRFTQYYWSSRDDAFEMAGVGEADVLLPAGPLDFQKLFAHMRRALPPHPPSLRYYGGFRFHTGHVKGERWKAFKEFRFVVPRFEVLRRRTGVFLACNAKRAHPRTNQETLDNLLADLAALQFPGAPPDPAVPPLRSREDLPDRAAWDALIGRTLDAFGHDFQKVVLARESSFTFEAPLDPVALLARLTRHTAPSFEFCFHPVEDRAFIGASPERLFKRTNCYLQSEAIAGTRPRGTTDGADKALGQALLDSDKDRREHRFVVQTLEEHFQHFCRHLLTPPDPSLMRLRNCQHLYTPLEGLLRHTCADATLLQALHPTPAVGGCPRDPALRWIEAEEPFDRGIYAAPVGWVGHDAAEFCVAIRSGLIRGNQLALYTGAGIVPGSTPQEEWDEIENKMTIFLDALAP